VGRRMKVSQFLLSLFGEISLFGKGRGKEGEGNTSTPLPLFLFISKLRGIFFFGDPEGEKIFNNLPPPPKIHFVSVSKQGEHKSPSFSSLRSSPLPLGP